MSFYLCWLRTTYASNESQSLAAAILSTDNVIRHVAQYGNAEVVCPRSLLTSVLKVGGAEIENEDEEKEMCRSIFGPKAALCEAGIITTSLIVLNHTVVWKVTRQSVFICSST